MVSLLTFIPHLLSYCYVFSAVNLKDVIVRYDLQCKLKHRFSSEQCIAQNNESCSASVELRLLRINGRSKCPAVTQDQAHQRLSSVKNHPVTPSYVTVCWILEGKINPVHLVSLGTTKATSQSSNNSCS